MVPLVAFCGSRSLPSSWSPVVAGCVRSVLAAGRGVAVCCCSGADELRLRSWSALPSWGPCSVFAAGDASGAGFAGSLSCLPFVRRAASRGASVSWLAGGPLSLPLPARLVRRAAACVRAAAALVCFGLSPASRGSLGECRLAASLGLPVVVFPARASSPPALGPGLWVAAGAGVWSAALRWAPASLFAAESVFVC